MKMKRSLDLCRFRTLAVLLARSATTAMTSASIAFGLILAVGTAFAAVDGFDAKGLPFAHEGFGVRRNFYQSGRISAKVADIAGLFELDYVGKQPYDRQNFFKSAAENCVWMHQFMPFVQIEGKPFRLTFANTVHYPFGYRSECTLEGVKLRHELVLDRNVVFRRMTVLENPAGKRVKACVSQMNAGLAQGVTWRIDGEKNALVTDWKETDASIPVEIGSAHPVVFPSRHNASNLRFDLVSAEPGDSHLFWWVFDKAPDEDLSAARMDRVFADFDAKRAKDAHFETGDALVDGWLGYVAPMSAAHEVDGRGAFRASPTYWIWGWDAMVHASALALCGRADEVRRMLAFHRDVADEKHGILHAYDTSFGMGSAIGGAAMPPAVQLYWVILLNDYVNVTGDAAFKAESLPFARKLVERAKASVDPVDGLPHARGYYPDYPEAVGQQTNDIALINCAVYWQGLCAWRELTGEGVADCERVRASIVERLWDAQEGYWSDSYDVSNGVRRAHYPLYGLFHVSSFARDLAPGRAAAFADHMRNAFFMNDRLAMFGWGTPAFCADGNQFGSYYPVTDRTYWNAQNAAGRVTALADFRRIVARHARVLTYPEGQTADVCNGDAADYSDELGNKQFFAAKGWLSDALDLWLGLDVRKDGLRFRPMNDGMPFAVRGLTVRGKTLDVEMSGTGARASYFLDGQTLADGFVPWSALKRERNTLKIEMAAPAVARPTVPRPRSMEAREASFADFDAKARAGERLTVVFFGGSLTWSANATEPNVTGFRGLMAKYLAEKYPAAHFTFVDAAIGGTGSNLGIFRLERDVLSKMPDLVFLEFACNDGGENTALPNTCCYEYLLREMIARGIRVQQMFFTFRNWTLPGVRPSKVHPRRDVYWQLARAYGTPVGDVYETPLWKRLNSGEVPLDDIWPIDGGHPNDAGYRMFADAGVRGFEKAIREGASCRVPEKPVFGTVRDVRRWNPVDGTLPKGWTRRLTYRTSLWYDGLSSRWMDDVAAFSGDARAPLALEATGNLFGVFGEADEKALTAEITAEGKAVASFNGYHRAGPGRLFIWRHALLDGWEDGVSRTHAFAVDPIPSGDPKGEFRIGSVCTATLVPNVVSKADGAEVAAEALERLDHARGQE